jgi:hypothetical protein
MLTVGFIVILIVCIVTGPFLHWTVREGARTLPRPVRHPNADLSMWTQPFGPDIQSQTMNQYVDAIISTYFDDNGVPWTNTVDLYTTLCVNMGNVDPSIKSQLNDVCYYILEIVIPNIPSTGDPTPVVAWPPIQYLSTGTFPVIVEPSYQVLAYNNTQDSYSWAYNYANLVTNNNFSFSSGATSPASSPGGTGPTDSSGSNPNGGNCPNNSCNIQCPTSCFSAMISASNQGSSTSGTGSGGGGPGSSTSFDLSGGNNSAGTKNTAKRIATSITNTVYIGNAVALSYTVTDEAQTSTATTLNDLLKTNILEWFFIQTGPNAGRPTAQGIAAFNQIWASNTQVMDEFHKDKLRDLVYYVMQTILPGLPTPTLPRSYVEWMPIQWLSHSNIL